jgi:hypothetical protein
LQTVSGNSNYPNFLFLQFLQFSFPPYMEKPSP